MSTTRSAGASRSAHMAAMPLVVVLCAYMIVKGVDAAATPVFCPPNQSVCSTNFLNPKWNGLALDWCRVFENQCGLPAAVEYCKQKGYATASTFKGPLRVLPPQKTIVALSGQICQAPHVCDTFSSITCTTFPHFHKPRWNNIPLDWCKTFEHDCGKPAADKYCQLKGFNSAAAFKGPLRLPADTTSIVPSSGAICHTPHVCDTFQWIACRK